MKYQYLIFLILVALVPVGAGAATLPSSDGSTTTLVSPVEAGLFEEHNEDIDPADIVLHRLSLELEELDESLGEYYDIENTGGWLGSLRKAWSLHRLQVHIRRIQMLVRSAERYEVLSGEDLSEVATYLDSLEDALSNS